MNWSGSWPVAASHWPRSMPWAWNCCTVPWTRWFRSALTIDSGASISTSSASASLTATHQALASLVELGARRCAPGGWRPTPSTVSNSPRLSDTQSSVSSGSDHLLHGGDRDDEVGRLVGALRRGGERELVAGGRADELVVEVVGDPALADLVGPVLGVQAEHLLAVAGGGEIERDVVAGLDRTVDVGERRRRGGARPDAPRRCRRRSP